MLLMTSPCLITFIILLQFYNILFMTEKILPLDITT